MKFATYEGPGGPRVACVADDGLIDLQQADAQLPATLRGLLALGKTGLERAAAAATKGERMRLEACRLLAPVPDPQKVICVGLNYADHARESGATPPPEPVLFSKFVSAVQAPEGEIVLPPESQEVDYEAELVVVIGTGGKRIPEARALEHVAGYCCGHDVSARDWQLRKPGGQWLMGKTFDTFAPMGPYLVTADEVGDPGSLDIQLRLNGQVMQKSNTRELIFSVPKLIAYLSQVCTLWPGDVIFTGTPAGVGASRKPPVFLKPGDVAEVEITRLGVLRNPVVAAS